MSDPYYRDPSVTLWLGDAEQVLAQMPKDSVDCIVTSPPYYGLRDYGVDGQIGLEETPQEYVTRLVGVFHEAARVLKADGTLWLNLADSYVSHPSWGRGGHSHLQGCGHDQVGMTSEADRRRFDRPMKSLLGIPWRVAFALQDDGWILRNDIIWHKRNAMPTSASDRLAIKHEDIFLLSRSERYHFDLDAIKVPATVQSEGSLTWDRDSDEPDRPRQATRQHRRGRTRSAPSPMMANPGDVWDIPTRAFKASHYATFPEDLPAMCIKAGCRPGGVVLDPFSGSGTTGLAALKSGCRYVGIDISHDYLDLSLKTRLAQGVLEVVS